MNKIFSISLLYALSFALLLGLAQPAAFAAGQDGEAPAATTEEVIPDPLKRETPRSMVSGLLGALGELDYDRTALYFDLPTATNTRQRTSAVAQARAFHAVLDNGGTLDPFQALSNDPNGKFNDDLPVEQERIGEIVIEDKKIPVLLTKGQDGDHHVWRISRETLAQVAAATKRTPVAETPVPDEIIVAGAPIKDWALLLGLGVLVFGGLWVVSTLIVLGMRKLVTDPDANGLYRFFEAAMPPVSLLIAVGVFYTWAEQLPVSIVARQTLLRYTGIVSVIALVWFGLRLVDAISDLVIARMQRAQRRQVVSVVTLARRAAKVLLLAFSAIAILSTFGIDVTTGIAALGIGGIALALGAQKTVENLVGSVTVIADRPMQVGDFIKVGDVVGTVEDVGIRSTRIRTNDRTVVTIPNGDLSARQIENFAPRDRFLFNPVIAVDYGISSAKLREALAIVQQVLAEEKNMAEGHRARLGSIGERSFNIEVFSYIDVHEFDTQVIIRETLLLTIFERLEAAGISLAFPTQTIVFSPAQLDAVRSGQAGAAGSADPADPAHAADLVAEDDTGVIVVAPSHVAQAGATPPPRS